LAFFFQGTARVRLPLVREVFSPSLQSISRKGLSLLFFRALLPCPPRVFDQISSGPLFRYSLLFLVFYQQVPGAVLLVFIPPPGLHPLFPRWREDLRYIPGVFFHLSFWLRGLFFPSPPFFLLLFDLITPLSSYDFPLSNWDRKGGSFFSPLFLVFLLLRPPSGTGMALPFLPTACSILWAECRPLLPFFFSRWRSLGPKEEAAFCTPVPQFFLLHFPALRPSRRPCSAVMCFFSPKSPPLFFAEPPRIFHR